MSERTYRNNVRLYLNDGLITQDISMSTGMKGDSLMVFASACGTVAPSNGVTVYNLVKSS